MNLQEGYTADLGLSVPGGHNMVPAPGAAQGSLHWAWWGGQSTRDAGKLQLGSPYTGGARVLTLSCIHLFGRVESALVFLRMQIISLSDLTANIFWLLTPFPGQERAVFPADPPASFRTLGYFDFREGSEG